MKTSDTMYIVDGTKIRVTGALPHTGKLVAPANPASTAVNEAELNGYRLWCEHRIATGHWAK